MLFEFRTSTRQGPVLLSSPHSGRLYPQRLLDMLSLSRDELRPLGDGPVDMLLEPALAQAAGLLAPLLPRTWIDLNRAPDEMDPIEITGSFPVARQRTLKVKAGLGLVPTRINGRTIYRRRLVAEDLHERLAHAYQPFHAALARELAILRTLHGVAVLLDCHSMPRSSVSQSGAMVDIVVGDRFGTSASATLTECVMQALRAQGLVVAHNRPFAGGHIIEAHGSPATDVHALQIELRRDLFLDEADYRLHRGAGRLGAALAAAVAAIGAQALRQHGRQVAA